MILPVEVLVVVDVIVLEDKVVLEETAVLDDAVVLDNNIVLELVVDVTDTGTELLVLDDDDEGDVGFTAQHD